MKFRTPVPSQTITNGDEALIFGATGARYIGNFHKSLPRHANGSGEVDPIAYQTLHLANDLNGDFETVPRVPNAAKLNNPQAGRAREALGPDPSTIHMLPAPGVLSASTAAEMVELFWMAKLRDQSFDTFAGAAATPDAIADIGTAYQNALTNDHAGGALQLGLDLPADATTGALDIRIETLFRAGLKDEQFGPLVSQFFLQDINYGAQLIRQTQFPYAASQDYLKTFPEWYAAQETGRDQDGNDYPMCNNFGSAAGPSYYETSRRRIATMRDLARFVNRDALHQAYFNAALLMTNWKVPTDPGNPYNSYARQAPFGTLGDPNLLALVSEVASRALKVVWRQKWLHRRLRPEAYGGLLHQQAVGEGGTKIAYGLPAWLHDGTLAIDSELKMNGYFLPLAFTAGSPTHPSYGAGHATVAGACVTILKAWFDESITLQDVFKKVNTSKQRDPSPYFPGQPGEAPFQLEIWQPDAVKSGATTDGPLLSYAGADAPKMTVLGELNKLAANVALGRSMGGVHYRSDNTRSLRLGEQVATIILSRIMPTYAERPTMSYTNFDGNAVTVDADGKVFVPEDADLEQFYRRTF